MSKPKNAARAPAIAEMAYFWPTKLIDKVAGATRHHGYQSGVGKPGPAMVTSMLAVVGEDCRGIGQGQDLPVDRADQQAGEPLAHRPSGGCRAAEQLEDLPEWCGTDPAPDLEQGTGGDRLCPAGQAGAELAPDEGASQAGEHDGGQEEVGHDAGRQRANPCLGFAGGLRQALGQFAQVPGGKASGGCGESFGRAEYMERRFLVSGSRSTN